MSIVLIDASADSLTVSWPESIPPHPKSSSSTTGSSYHLQYRRCFPATTSTNDDDDDDGVYETLSKTLRTTLVRKKNLIDPDHHGFIFRVRTSANIDEKNIIDINTDTTATDEYYRNHHNEWMTHTEPFYLLTQEQVTQRMMTEPPIVTYGGTNASLRIAWKGIPINTTNSTTTTSTNTSTGSVTNNNTTDTMSSTTTPSYEIQMRENQGGVPWTTIATAYTSTEVRKKNLISTLGYQFRIRPHPTPTSSSTTTSTSTSSIPFSTPSEPVVALSYNTNCVGLQRLFASITNQTLLSNIRLIHSRKSHGTNNKQLSSPPMTVPLAETLGGKEFILLYASAHWCGPCRQYTPKLVTWYQQLVISAGSSSTSRNNDNNHPTNESTVEIVFLSADHDEASFQSYYRTMPWTAVAYDDTAREQLLSYIRVTGIPRLAVLDGRTGAIIEDNAVNKPFDLQRWRKLVSK
jgi:thiol-disulfide isomerase/thioredoxin